MPGDRDVNEVEITSYRVDPNVGIRNVIQCFDFFWANYLTGNKNKVPLPYDIIYDNGKTDWLCVVLPEISCLGHWKDSGFILKAFLIKTDLNTSALQTKYLGFTVKNDETPKKDVSVGMYDYFMQVQLNTGFGAATNKKYLVQDDYIGLMLIKKDQKSVTYTTFIPEVINIKGKNYCLRNLKQWTSV